MKVSPISSLWSVSKSNTQNQKNYIHNPVTGNSENDIFVKSEPSVQFPKPIMFMGYKVYIIDDGVHADFMKKFSEAISKKYEVNLFNAINAPEYRRNKPMLNILDRLQYANRHDLTEPDSYVALPVSINVSLKNLAEQYKQAMGYYLHLRPHSTQTCKDKLLTFLKLLYEQPDKYRKYIRAMDPENKGLEFAYGIIQEINKLKCKKVYIPASEPLAAPMARTAKDWGNTPELTNFLATGYDKDGKVQQMKNFLQEHGEYDFNLLSLSDANIVNLKKVDGRTDHLFSAYDTTVKDGARGVYNLTPVRENGKIVGYSFNDSVTNEYPVNEFPFNEKLSKISKFVGLSTDEAVANDEMTARFKQALNENRVTDEFAEKLYPVWKLFSPDELRNKKIYEKGDFVDYKLENYFRRNQDYKIIYPIGDTENSGRPSVMPLRGSNFAIFSAIKRDVENRDLRDTMLYKDNIVLNKAIYSLLSASRSSMRGGNYQNAEKILTDVVDYIEMEGFTRKNSEYMAAYKLLADAKFRNGDYVGANGIYNFYLNNKCKNYLERVKVERYQQTKDELDEIIALFKRLAEVAQRRGEKRPEMECLRAAKELEYGSELGNKVLYRRANDDINIGDIFG